MRWVSLVFLFGVRSLVRAECCVPFLGFGNIRSTLGKHPSKNTYGICDLHSNPTGLGIATVIFLKLTPMVRFGTAPDLRGNLEDFKNLLDMCLLGQKLLTADG